MSRLELLNSGSLRLDGRKVHELRSVAIQIDAQGTSDAIASAQGHEGRSSVLGGVGGSTSSKSDGSARLEQGLTIVNASVFGPREGKSRATTLHDRAKVNVTLTFEPWCGRERRKRARGDRRIAEMESLLESTFESVIQTHLYPRSVIDIFVDVENQDGGVLACAINAVSLALSDAGVSLLDYVVGLSVGLHLQSGQILLDLSAFEEGALPHLVAATLPKSGKIAFVQLETRIHTTALQEMLAMVGKACAVLHEEMDAAMHERTRRLAIAMGGGAGQIGGDGAEDIEIDEVGDEED